MLNCPSALAEALKRAQQDTRWDEFRKCVRSNVANNIIILDRSTFAFSTACYKLELAINLEGGKKYIVIFYISIIADYYAYKISEVFTEIDYLVDMLKNEKDLSFLERVKSIFSNGDILMSLSDRDKQLIQILAEKQNYSELLAKEQQFKQNRVIQFNEFSTEIAYVLEPMLNCQSEIFGYDLFDKNHSDSIVNGIETNLRENGTATLFDCIFTDFSDLDRQNFSQG